MIVECNQCHAKYNVDDKRIPAAGVKVRCQKCQNIIIIKKPTSEPISTEPQPVQPPAKTVHEPKPEPPRPVETPSQPGVEVPVPEIPTDVPKPPRSEIPVPPEPEPPSGPEPVVIQKPKPTAAPQMTEEDKKWHERARRLAKALASDLVLYNRDKVEHGLRENKLVQLLGSEIRRSWEYYCQQIPKHIVENSDYFKEQLNKIVGKGKELFK